MKLVDSTIIHDLKEMNTVQTIQTLAKCSNFQTGKLNKKEHTNMGSESQ